MTNAKMIDTGHIAYKKPICPECGALGRIQRKKKTGTQKRLDETMGEELYQKIKPHCMACGHVFRADQKFKMVR